MLAVTVFTAISGLRYIVTNWRLFVPLIKGKKKDTDEN
jgi:hypothetical protein